MEHCTFILTEMNVVLFYEHKSSTKKYLFFGFIGSVRFLFLFLPFPFYIYLGIFAFI